MLTIENIFIVGQFATCKHIIVIGKTYAEIRLIKIMNSLIRCSQHVPYLASEANIFLQVDNNSAHSQKKLKFPFKPEFFQVVFLSTA